MKKFLKIVLIQIPVLLITASVLMVFILKWVPVWFTPLMISRSIQFRDDPAFHTTKKWCPLEDISPEMMKAVITSEDNLFPKHNGFDKKAIKQAIQEKKDGKRLRGGSTISQQTAKNVFTFQKRTYWRKGVEAWFTFLIEKIWGKQRIMEVYLNVAEMGKGVYGVQAASQKFFNKDAAKLTRHEACTLAAVLPSPLRSNAGSPSNYIVKRTNTIAQRIPNIIYPDWVERKKKATD